MKLFLIMLGIAMVLTGFIVVFLPIPLGLIMMAIGTLLILSASPQARRFVKWLRSKVRFIDRGLHKAAKILPPKMAEPLVETTPDDDDHEEHNGKRDLAIMEGRIRRPMMMQTQPVRARWHAPSRRRG